ncbi:AP-2 complex subunit beta, partial [Bonamia ostreae]
MYSTNTSNFFESNQKGEIYELRKDLNSVDRGIIKNAVKKIIEMMSLGEDLSQLFPDVIKSLSTKDLELKKLVYLYTIHYAHKQPEKAILVVNTFQKDAKSHPNPLMRALAIRTMGCINVEKITEHLCDPLSDALSDSDPYVRKTAVICVAKLFKINEEMVIEKGFLDRLHLCLSDSNPMVVSNAVAAIENIAKKRPSILSKISPSNCRQLVSAINECTEWGQVYILEILAICFNKISDPVFVLERIAPRLSHSNPAVVLSAVKLVTILAKGLKNKENVFLEKIRPSLITLLCSKS